MPASSTDNICQIEETLKSSLKKRGGDLDSSITSSSKKILLTQIEFKPAEKPYSLQIDSLRKKYIPLNPQQNHQVENGVANKNISMNSSEEGNDGLPTPKIVLYPEENIKLEWKKIQRIGAGLVNMGNTCFLNSTLQCLTYTPPLVNYCLSNEHNDTCRQTGFCMMCELQRHIKRCYDNYGNAIKPQSILQKLRMIAKHMHWGRQEDAHEFLRYLVEALQKSCLNLNFVGKLDKFSKETTVVNQIFGGFLRSQVQCLKCKERSNTYDPLLDISLDIKTSPTLEKAFEHYVKPEMLVHENAYMCTKCKQKVPAQKRFSIHKPPNVLTVSLKRFEFGRMSGKITRQINFQEKLNIRPYMSNKQGEPVIYNLYAVLVHTGVHCNSGHYFCYVKSSNSVWYCMNDSMVTQVSASRVLSSEAYLLFYIRSKPSVMQKTKLGPVTSKSLGNVGPSSSFIGPVHPSHSKPTMTNVTVNGLKPHHNLDHGMPVSRKSLSETNLHPSTSLPHASTHTKPSNPIPSPANREKVTFGIKPKQFPKPQDHHKDEKPRIVMQIKNGKVTTFEKSPNGKSKLVPYDGESDSDNDTGHGTGKKTNGSVKTSHEDQNKAGNGNMSKMRNGSGIVFDQKLNATTSVPGNVHLLETSLKEDRMTNGKKHGRERTPDRKNGSQYEARHGLENSLTCVTSSKVNATSSWHVLNQDNILSPSRGSNSSKDSTNSTTGWKIKEMKENHLFPKTSDYQHVGWKISDNGEQHSVNDKHCKYVNSDKTDGSLYPQLKKSSEESSKHDEDNNINDDNYQIKKHKKKKRKHQDYDNKDYKNESDTEVPRKKHKKKKKKHKHKDRRENEESGSDKKLKQRHDDEEHNDPKKKKHDSESDDSTELVWVEKTKDSLLHKSSHNTVPTQSWDHHVRDGYTRQKNNHHASKSTWDGSKTSSVTESLERNSLHSYGTSVSSWDGGKSSLDVEEDKDRKRHWSDDYDDEIDKGKTKKIKKSKSDYDFQRLNPFQYFQDEKNKEPKLSAGDHPIRHSQSYHSYHGNHGHRGHNYHRNHHNKDLKKYSSNQKY